MATLTGIAKNTNGCPIPATWFLRSDRASCKEIKKRYISSGDGFASHTVTHKNLSTDIPSKTISKEINGVKDYLVKECGLPKDKIQGFRGPYRTVTPEVRKVSSNRNNCFRTLLTSIFPMPNTFLSQRKVKKLSYFLHFQLMTTIPFFSFPII